MNVIGYEGIGAVVMTMRADLEMEPGTVIEVQPYDVVYPSKDGDAVYGVALSTRSNIAQVQLGGAVKVKCENNIPTGWRRLVADGNGGVREAVRDDSGAWEENARQMLVLHYDVEANNVTIWL